MKKTINSQKRKAIWLVAGGPMQLLAAQKVKALGYALILTDGSKNCICAKLADKFVHLDTFAINENVAMAKKLRTQYDICAVFTAGADCHETVAVVAQHLGVHGIDPAISHMCRHKNETRSILSKAGIAQPTVITAKSHAEAVDAAIQIGLPVALKATDNSGSRGFHRIDKIKDLTKSLFKQSLQNGTSGLVIVEELLIPLPIPMAEQSVETVWYNGKMRWFNWTDRLFRKDFDSVKHPWKEKDNPYKNMSWAVELAHFNPADHGPKIQKEVETLLYEAGNAIGMRKQKGGHILKADIMLTINGPRIIELTPRCSGGWDSAYSTPARGADCIGGVIHLALNGTLNEENWKRYFAFSNPNRIVSVLSKVNPRAKDCIGRRFAGGVGKDRPSAMKAAYENMCAKQWL